MARHARTNKSHFKKVLGLFLVLPSLLISGLAQAVTVDTQGNALSFNSAQVNGLGPQITQPDADGSSIYDIGENLTVGEYVDFYNVITDDDGQQIDARVTVLSLVDQEGTSGTADELEFIDEADADSGENAYLKISTDYQVGQGNSYAELKIQFYSSLSTSPVAATLQNVKMSTYDLDAYQYVELNNFDTYAVSTNTTLDVSEVRDSYTRFIDTSGVGYSGTDSQTKGRATVTFNAVSEVVFRVGKVEPDGITDTGSSTFYLDFSAGQSWSGLEGETVVAPSAVIDTPSAPRAPRLPRLDDYSTSTDPAGKRLLRIDGVRLWCVNTLTIDGAPVTFERGFSTPWYEYLIADISSVQPGSKTMVVDSCMGNLTFENWFHLRPNVEPKSMWVKLNAGGLNEATREKISAFSSSLGDGYSRVRCIVNSQNGEASNLKLAREACVFAATNDLSGSLSIPQSKDSFEGRGYWINIWASGK